MSEEIKADPPHHLTLSSLFTDAIFFVFFFNHIDFVFADVKIVN